MPYNPPTYFPPSYFGGVGLTITPTRFRAALFSQLTVTADLVAVVGSRIFPLVLPQDVSILSQPALTYQVISNVRVQHLTGPSGVTVARVQFTPHAMKPSDATAILDALRFAFDGFTGLLGGVVDVIGCTQQDDVDSSEWNDDGSALATNNFHQDYMFRYRETNSMRS